MNRLSELRRTRGLTALQLAQEASTLEGRVYAFERERFNPHPDEAQRIAVALGESVENLFPRMNQPRGMARRHVTMVAL